MSNFLARLFGKKGIRNAPGPYDNALVIRTDFSDDSAWNALCEEIQRPVGEFRAYVDLLADRKFHNVTAGQVGSMITALTKHSFLFLVDAATFASAERPILAIDLSVETPKTLRVIPSQVWSIENNLSVGNMEFDEFARCADADGIFRGFR